MTVTEYEAIQADFNEKIRYMSKLSLLATPLLQKEIRIMFGSRERLTPRELAIVQLAEETSNRLQPEIDKMTVALSQPYLEA